MQLWTKEPLIQRSIHFCLFTRERPKKNFLQAWKWRVLTLWHLLHLEIWLGIVFYFLPSNVGYQVVGFFIISKVSWKNIQKGPEVCLNLYNILSLQAPNLWTPKLWYAVFRLGPKYENRFLKNSIYPGARILLKCLLVMAHMLE